MTKAIGPLYRVSFRRRREGVTDFEKRLAMLKSGRVRAVVRRTDRVISVQFTEFDAKGDKVLAGANSKQLLEYGYSGKANTPSAYLTGLLAGSKAKAVGVKSAIADIGRLTSTRGGVVYAAIAGISDSGITIPFDREMAPSADRISGKHAKSKGATGTDEVKAKILANQKTSKEAKP